MSGKHLQTAECISRIKIQYKHSKIKDLQGNNASFLNSFLFLYYDYIYYIILTMCNEIANKSLIEKISFNWEKHILCPKLNF